MKVGHGLLFPLIEEEPDWPTSLSFAPGGSIAQDYRRQVRTSLETLNVAGGADFRGFAMRGISQAIAECYKPEYLERGMESCMRGIRNAFAERRLYLIDNEKRTVESAISAVGRLAANGEIKLPPGYKITIEKA